MKSNEYNQISVNTFDAHARQYLAYFKGFRLYQPTYDLFLNALSHQHKSLLEVACGPGQVSHYLLEKNPQLEIFGIDLAPQMIALATALNPTAQYKIMDVRNLGQLEQDFDAVMCGFCLPYLNWTDTLNLLKSMAVKLNEGGIIYISTIKHTDQPAGFQKSKDGTGGVYTYHHSTDDIHANLEVLGLKILTTNNINHLHHGVSNTDHFILAQKV